MRVVMLVSVIVSISGCAVFSDDYTCGRVPESGCTPVSDVYEKSSGDFVDNRGNIYQKDEEKEKQIPNIKVSASNKAISYASPGDPILTKPVVMRVLYHSYENEQKDLDAGGYTFLRMRESEWILEK